MSIKYCIECGSRNPDSAKFCSHCGHKQPEMNYHEKGCDPCPCEQELTDIKQAIQRVIDDEKTETAAVIRINDDNYIQLYTT